MNRLTSPPQGRAESVRESGCFPPPGAVIAACSSCYRNPLGSLVRGRSGPPLLACLPGIDRACLTHKQQVAMPSTHEVAVPPREVSGLSTPSRNVRPWKCRPQIHVELSCLHDGIRHVVRAPISPRSPARSGEDSNCSVTSLVAVCRWALACLNCIYPEATLSGNDSIPQAHFALAAGILCSLRLPSYEATLTSASLLNPISQYLRRSARPW